jgi:hypothetical protein
MQECRGAEARLCDQPPRGDWAMGMRFCCESSARPGENLCDTVVANFLFDDQRLVPRAFHTKARSHFPITTLFGFFERLKDEANRWVADD